MSASSIGALIGLALGLVSFVALRTVAARIEADGSGGAEKRQVVDVLRYAAMGELIVFPIVGYLVGPVLA